MCLGRFEFYASKGKLRTLLKTSDKRLWEVIARPLEDIESKDIDFLIALCLMNGRKFS